MDATYNRLTFFNWSLLFSSFIFITYALALIVPNGYSFGPALLLLFYFAFSFRIKYLRQVDGLGKSLILVFFVYFLNLSFDIVYHDMPFREFDRPSRLVFALGVMFLLIKFPPKSSALWYGLAVGSILTGGLAIWQKFFIGVERAGIHMSPIQFGNLAMLMGLLCLVGAVSGVRTGYARLLLFLGFVFGVLASLLSGSRGGWVGLPLIVIFIFGCYSDSKKEAIKRLLLPSILLSTFVFAIPQLGVKDRIDSAFDDVEQYFENHTTNTSVGTRLELWRAGLIMFFDKPILGWGEEGYAEEKARLADSGIVADSIRYNSHLHNDYIDALVVRGGIGFLVLLFFYLMPLLKILSLLRRGNVIQGKPYLVAMAVVIFSYMDFGLTQVFWAHNSGAMFYSFIMVFLYVLYINERGEA